MRFRRPEVAARLKAEADARHESSSALAEELIDEGLRTRRHPLVVFRDGPVGRHLVRQSHALTQPIGETAHERGVQAIKSPSATGVDDVLALLPENFGPATLQVELVEVWESSQDM